MPFGAFARRLHGGCGRRALFASVPCARLQSHAVCWVTLRAAGCCCYKEMQRLGMHRQSATRAGNCRRHRRIRNAGQQRCTSRKQQPLRPTYMHLTRTPLIQHSAPCDTKAPATDTVAHPPKAPAGTRVGHVLREPRRRGSPPAPGEQAQAPQHQCARTGRTK